MKKLFQQEKQPKHWRGIQVPHFPMEKNFAWCTCIIMIMQDDAGGEAAYSSIIMIKQLWTSLKTTLKALSHKINIVTGPKAKGQLFENVKKFILICGRSEARLCLESLTSTLLCTLFFKNFPAYSESWCFICQNFDSGRVSRVSFSLFWPAFLIEKFHILQFRTPPKIRVSKKGPFFLSRALPK